MTCPGKPKLDNSVRNRRPLLVWPECPYVWLVGGFPRSEIRFQLRADLDLELFKVLPLASRPKSAGGEGEGGGCSPVLPVAAPRDTNDDTGTYGIKHGKGWAGTCRVGPRGKGRGGGLGWDHGLADLRGPKLCILFAGRPPPPYKQHAHERALALVSGCDVLRKLHYLSNKIRSRASRCLPWAPED
jgi:hypothetical protein